MSSSSANIFSNVADGLGSGRISSWAPASTAAEAAGAKSEDTNTVVRIDKTTSFCPHLEELMFPKYLSLDCNKLDDFCMGRVTDKTSGARLYIEALHLKDFLKDKKRGKNKRASPSRSPSKKKSRESDTKDAVDEKALSQLFWGGMEGKRTLMLQEETYPILEELQGGNKPKNDATTRADDSLDTLLDSELRLRKLQKTFKLRDRSCMFDNFVCNTSNDLPPQDDEFKALEELTKPLPHMIDQTATPTLQNANPETSHEAKQLTGMDAAETKINGAASQEMDTIETATTGHVESSDAKSEEPNNNPLSHQEGTGTKMEVDDKVSEVVSSTVKSDENTTAVEQVRSDVEINSTPVVETPTKEQTSHSTSALDLTSQLEEEKTPTSPVGVGSKSNGYPVSHGSVFEETAESLHKRAIREGKDASFAANKMLAAFCQNRRNFWNASDKSEPMACVWCSSSEATAMKSTKKTPSRQFGLIEDTCVATKEVQRDNGLVTCASGDNLIQCLECNLIGCRSGIVGGKSHAMLHFLMSGHRYGITCGESGELFCMGCGDIVQHECFDRERERVFLEQNHPSLSWQESLIIRGINPSSFTVTKEQGYVWRGLLASYPIPAPSQYVRASQSALRRLLMFRGCSTNTMADLGPTAFKLTMQRQAHLNNDLIATPVGLYNLGNTCYLNSTLQCLVNCVSLQDAFLSKLVHPYQCCSTLKGGKTSCLACEMDKLFLEHYGSCNGIDAIAALEEEKDTSGALLNEPEPEHCGHPIIPSNFLAQVWQNSTVRHLARHDQHDAQEFYHALIDGLETDVLSYQKKVRSMKQGIKTQVRRGYQSPEMPNESSIKDIFEGSLRSVLICDECGCKRSQNEPFLNLSLPLKNEFPSLSDAVVAKEKVTTRSETSTLTACLNHFTEPETLQDHIYCPSCNRKTKTLKQHTFGKLPRILCLHLKRFDALTNKKISDFVSYPATNLDMGQYLPHWCEMIFSADKNDKQTQTQTNVESPSVLYDLYATVNHRGSLHQGHYTSNIKCNDHWYHCNDAFVCNAGEGNGEKEVLQAEGARGGDAYMLFYRRHE